jgi:hypothetical protein
MADPPVHGAALPPVAVPGLATALDNLATAMTALAAPKPPGKKLITPIFKGEPGKQEDPCHHLPKAIDWLEDCRYPEAEWPREFKHTLDKWARTWYDSIVVPGVWEEMKTLFLTNYSLQGKNKKQLRRRWRNFQFNPLTDNVQVFITDVRETALNLRYNDETVVDLIKECMPETVYGALYNVVNLRELIGMCNDMFAPDTTANNEIPSGIAPFAKMSTTNIASPTKKDKASTPDTNVLMLKSINKLAETLNRFGDPRSGGAPYKPYITRGRGRGRGRYQPDRYNQRYPSSGPYSRNQNGNRNYRGSFNRGSSYRGQNNWRGGRGRGQRFQSSPTVRHPRVASRPVKPEDRCFNCDEKGHFQRECPLLNRKPVQQENAPENANALHSLNEIPWSDPLTSDYECTDGNAEAISNLHEAMRHLNSIRGATD